MSPSRGDQRGPQLHIGTETFPPALDRIMDEDAVLREAAEFIEQFHESTTSPLRCADRLDDVRRQISQTGTYVHTRSELVWGARVAWRNSARCIGRLYWNSLRVRDLRDVSSADELIHHCVEHAKTGFNGGNVRSVMSVFAPDTPSVSAMRIVNGQLGGYAGYELTDGRRVGDRKNRDTTMLATRSGWTRPKELSPFDVLPLMVRDPDERIHVRTLPPDATPEVMIEHPRIPWFGDLGLRWFAVPVITDMALYIGGITYPAVPFNGWFMSSEIAARDLGDVDRYNVLPVIAEKLGLRVDDPTDFALDRAAIELLRAVHHSFDRDGVRITDHHTESERFLRHQERERHAGRVCPADWSWIVPPVSSSLTPVFHRYFDFPRPTGPQLYRPSTTTEKAPDDRHTACGRSGFER
jgi:nitric-oxide synthase